jgi:hypothetical protein
MMSPEEHAKVNDFIAKHRKTDAEVFHNGFHEITPVHLLDSLLSAKGEISFSNYDCNNLDRVMEIVFRYCEEHNIPWGNHLPETLKI